MDKFDDYLQGANLHPEIKVKCPPLPDFENVILYGPAGVGKYTQMLRLVKPYSAHGLKYEKRVYLSDDPPFSFKLSDVHYEVDMEMLGCTPKVLWNDVYNHIKDIIQSKFPDKHGIIVCKNFQGIDAELLEIFYSYMQSSIKFILLTDAISFIPSNVITRCRVVPVMRPTDDTFQSCLGYIPTGDNIKAAPSLPDHRAIVCDKILAAIQVDTPISVLREDLYTILVFDLGVEACMWYMMSKTLQMSPVERHAELLEGVVHILHCFATNYRPIYHLEAFAYLLIRTLL